MVGVIAALNVLSEHYTLRGFHVSGRFRHFALTWGILYDLKYLVFVLCYEGLSY